MCKGCAYRFVIPCAKYFSACAQTFRLDSGRCTCVFCVVVAFTRVMSRQDVERNPSLASEWTSGPRRLGTPAGQLQDWAEGRQRWGPGVVLLGLLGQWGPMGRP